MPKGFKNFLNTHASKTLRIKKMLDAVIDTFPTETFMQLERPSLIGGYTTPTMKYNEAVFLYTRLAKILKNRFGQPLAITGSGKMYKNIQFDVGDNCCCSLTFNRVNPAYSNDKKECAVVQIYMIELDPLE